jgi:hypothetical protein
MADQKTELEVLQDISKKMDESKELQTKEIQSLKEEAEKKAGKYEAEVKALKDELAAKGATIGEIQGEVKELKAKGGRIRSGANEVKTLTSVIAESIGDNKEKFILAEKKSGPMDPIEIKTVGTIASANLTGTGNNYLQYLPWQPGMEPTGQTRFRDIFPTYQSDVDFVRYPRANSPIGEGSFGRQATESAGKSQVDRDYTMVDLTLKAMAGYAIVSRQSLRNITFLQSWLPTSMLEQLLDAEDFDFSNALVGAATGSNTASPTPVVDKIIYYIKNLRKAKHSANFVAIDPDKWAEILTYRTDQISDFKEKLTIDATGNVRILGRPVYDVNWLTGGRILVGDSRKAGIVQSEGLTLRQSDSHGNTFTQNETTFLIERTEGLAIFRTEAFVTAVL